jgi:hypothetical protein
MGYSRSLLDDKQKDRQQQLQLRGFFAAPQNDNQGTGAGMNKRESGAGMNKREL